jgi:hypothetical protein
MFEIIFHGVLLQMHPANTPWDFVPNKRACGWQEVAFAWAYGDSPAPSSLQPPNRTIQRSRREALHCTEINTKK